jgi:hypothetical protein
MGKKVKAEMKKIFEAALSMTVLVNKLFDRKYDNFYTMSCALEEEEPKKRK